MLLPRSAEGTITRVDNAKITVFGCGIESEGTETQGTVLIRNAEDMLNYNKSEEKALEEVRPFCYSCLLYSPSTAVKCY